MQYGLIGEKLGHSFSKIIHNELYNEEYELKEIAKADLDSFMKEKSFKAINVTIPYKEDVIPYLDFVDDNAKKIGAVNTIINKRGKLYGYNTDFRGLISLIKFAEIDIKDKKVLILGSGGTSKTALAVSEELGAKYVFRVSRNKTDDLISYEDVYQNHLDADIIINTTPCGMYPNIDSSAVDINRFGGLSGIVDAVYNPLCSKLVIDAKNNGIKAIGGLYMLVAQAFFAAEMFIDKRLDLTEIERIYNLLLKEKQNLVLIGMPGCGKTTIGKAVAKECNKQFIDSDKEIVLREKTDIPKIFKFKGEEYFRKVESEVIAELSIKQGVVIATGGGVVLDSENVNHLKQNGIVIFIDRLLEKLVTSSDRPLSQNREMLKKRYDERYDIYKSSADIIISANDTLDNNVKKVLEVIK